MIFESGRKWGVASHIIADAIKDKISHYDFREQALKNKLKEVKSTASAKYVPQFSLKNYILAKANGEKLERTEQMVVDSAREDFGTIQGTAGLFYQIYASTHHQHERKA